MKHERRARALTAMQRRDPSDHNPMIAALVDRLDDAAERRAAAFQTGAAFPGDERKRRRRRFLPHAGEIAGKLLLTLAEDVDRESLGRPDQLTHVGGLPHAEEHERWIERQ